ncbi:30S ribosomal protein S5 [Candidatus Mycoplasma haematolamae str. Purdue]|uniref:Small ribosomal subunit protein uS5 n=1 Tax=Mycoplasma haematolamae (strain Purdue) TaxID=1212765 RepID=I7CFV5_MYCHA|nr:30S ribosomal protein S5 [Candidatus Mycoplasma haematolamae]AFO52106.1 30S ribosomal protein S5 [Candidatus Mycoplasma haematolamae str. Purdue]
MSSATTDNKKPVHSYDYRRFGKGGGEQKKGESILGGASFLREGEQKKEEEKKFNVQVSEFEEKVIKVKRVSKTTRGGRQSRVWVLVAAGNRKGKIGFAIGKSKEYSTAFYKAAKKAAKTAVRVPMNSKGTIYHEYLGKHNASRILLKPAKEGTGIIAGGPVKKLLLLAGYKDLYSKNLGANNPINMIRATINALQSQKSPRMIAKLRDKTFEELFHLPPKPEPEVISEDQLEA